MWGDIAIAFMIVFVTAFMATPHTINLARRVGAVDTPNDERRISSHSQMDDPRRTKPLAHRNERLQLCWYRKVRLRTIR